MQREFIYTSTFNRCWKAAGLGENDLERLEETLLKNPKAGDPISGLPSARKVRFAYEKRGKSGSIRVIYVDVVRSKCIYLLLAYPKNVQTNLTEEQMKILRNLISGLKEE